VLAATPLPSLGGVIHDTWPSSRYGARFVQGYFKKDVSVHEDMDTERKKLIDTVTKMLALADSTSFEAESSTAKAKAAELIAKYDIRAEGDLAGFKLEGEMRGGAAMPSYEFYLSDAVGRFCGVLVLRRGPNYLFFGKPQDLAAFRYMRDITSAQQDRAWMDYLSAHPDRIREKVSWKYSFADGVHEKVDELMRAATVQQKAMRHRLYSQTADTIHAIIYGTVVVACVQGTLGGLMFWWLSLPTPLLWGLVMGLLAIVPVLGAFVVWIPAAIFLALDGNWRRL
jgi:hypothetical protein